LRCSARHELERPSLPPDPSGQFFQPRETRPASFHPQRSRLFSRAKLRPNNDPISPTLAVTCRFFFRSFNTSFTQHSLHRWLIHGYASRNSLTTRACRPFLCGISVHSFYTDKTPELLPYRLSLPNAHSFQQLHFDHEHWLSHQSSPCYPQIATK